jgi:hypothetical protein
MTPLFFIFVINFPFEEDLALHLNNSEFDFVPSLIEIGQLVLEKVFSEFLPLGLYHYL